MLKGGNLGLTIVYQRDNNTLTLHNLFVERVLDLQICAILPPLVTPPTQKCNTITDK